MESLTIVDGLVELSDGLIAIDIRCETLKPPSVAKIISRFMCFDIAHMEESGNDFRIITRGTWPEGIPLSVEADEFTGIVHTDGHFPASEDVFAGENKVANAQPQIDWLAREVFMKAPLNAWQADADLLTEDAIRWMVMREDACGGYDEKREGTTLKGKGLRKLLYGHFRNGQTIGLHPQDAEWNCRWFGFDLDCKPDYPNRDEVAKRNTAYGLEIARRLRLKGLHPLIESSNGIGGLHIWVKLDRKIPVPAVWCFAQEIMADNAGHGFTETPETFPKSKQQTTFGNWLRLPGKHHKLDHWSYFLNEDGSPMTLDESVQAWLELPESNADLIPDAPTEPERAKPKPSPTVSLDSLGAGLGAAKTAEKHIESIPWPDLLKQFDWKPAGDTKWTRPGKESGTSGNLHHSEKHGAVMFTVFTSSVPGVEPHKYSKWRFYIHSLGLKDDIKGQLAAARTLFGDAEADRIDKEHQRAYMKAKEIQPQADISAIISLAADHQKDDDYDEETDENFCLSMVPESGLIRMVFEHYWNNAVSRTPTLGLASAVSFCEAIFGRRVASETNLRTNDYNIVIAPSGSGKEACESSLMQIMMAANCPIWIPGDIQSGNGLTKAVADCPTALWMADEIGKVLEAVLDKRGDGHQKKIAAQMLKLYGKSSGIYTGAAHATGAKNMIVQPHLVLLGLATPDVFRDITVRNITDGFIGRIAFWSLQRRPKIVPQSPKPVTEQLARLVREWFEFQPMTGNISNEPAPPLLQMTAEARHRHKEHAENIQMKMGREFDVRQALWARAAARSMLLAVVHRVAKLESVCQASVRDCEIGIDSVEWGIRLSNWLSRTSCSLIQSSVHDPQPGDITQKVLAVLRVGEFVSRSTVLNSSKLITASPLRLCVELLESSGRIEVKREDVRGKTKESYRLVSS